MPAQGPGTGVGVNWALSSNGGVAYSASSREGYLPSVVNDGDRSGATSYWWAGSPFPANNCNYVDGNYQYVAINFNTHHPIGEIDIFQVQDSATTDTPTPGMPSSMYGLAVYHLQYCPMGVTCTDGAAGTGWVEPPGGYIYAAQQNGANHAWNKLTFPPAEATAVRALIECGYAFIPYLIELEAWDTTAAGVNVAASANGGVAQATSTYDPVVYPASATIDGDRSAWNWGAPAQGGGWNSAVADSFPEVLEVTFQGARPVSEVDVFGIQDSYWAPEIPTLSQTSTSYGLTNFQVQYCPTGSSCSDYTLLPGTGWTDVSGSPVTNNFAVWRQFTFAPVSATRIRVVVTAAAGSYARIAEVEAWDYSHASGTLSSDASTALDLRRQMLGESCGAPSPASLNHVPGFYEHCGANFLTWSASTGAWSFANPSALSNRFLGLSSSASWPDPTPEMTNLGWPVGPTVGSNPGYSEFQRGIMAVTPGLPPRVIGGIVNDVGASGGPDRSKTVNTLLTSAWLNQHFANKFPATDTVEYALGIPSSRGQPTCGTGSSPGNRGFYFTTQSDPYGYATTFTVKDGSTGSHLIQGNNQRLWASTLSADCSTMTKLGWPISDEQPYVVQGGLSATHQEFEGGTIKYEPENCTGKNLSQISLGQGPTHLQELWDIACNSFPLSCTNSDAQISTGGGFSYYWHCGGLATAGPGATISGVNPAMWYSGLTITSVATGCTYIVNDPTYSTWLHAGTDGTIEGAIAKNPPPTDLPACQAWAYDTSGSQAGSVQFTWDFCSSGNCLNDTPVDFYRQYTTASGYTSPASKVMTMPAGTYANPQWGSTQEVPGVYNAKNCVYATFRGYTTSTVCQYLHADDLPRKPKRLTLTLGISPGGGRDGPVFVRLQDKEWMDSTVAAPYDNYTWLDLPGAPFQSDHVYSFDISTANINDLDDITQILVGSPGDYLCVNWMQLTVDDDGVFNIGGDNGNSGPGSAYRVAFLRNYLDNPGHCIWTGNVDFNNYNAPGTALVKADFNELRNSPDWQYQHTYWTDVQSVYAGNTTPVHFTGFPDYNSLKAEIYQEFSTLLHDNGYHFTPDRAMKLTVFNSNSPPTVGATYLGAIPLGSDVNDVLHVQLFYDGEGSVSFTYELSFDLQLVTHCDSNSSIKYTDVVPMNISVEVGNFWAEPLTTPAWIVGAIYDAATQSAVSQNLKKVIEFPATPAYRVTWSPEFNVAGNGTDSTLWPGLGLDGRNFYCSFNDQ